MINQPQMLKATLSSIFRRKGLDGKFTRLFENLEPRHREWLLRMAQSSSNELPIIGSAEGQDKWLLLTTKRIVWCLGANIQSLSIDDISDVVADFEKLKAAGRRLDEMTELQVLTMNGDQHSIQVEQGAPLSGVWNALKTLGARNRIKK